MATDIWAQKVTDMKTDSARKAQQASLHCSYDFMYEPIYTPSYNISFIFYDEDEVEDYEEEEFCPRIH